MICYLDDLFSQSVERSNNYDYRIQISLMEIYNENIRDLLSENQVFNIFKNKLKMILNRGKN